MIEHSAPPTVRIPGGWAIQELRLGNRKLALWIPTDPDAFLEDEESVAAHGPSPDKPERSDIPFWQYLWPAAEIMARLVYAHDWPSPGPVLELGAGLGLVGLAALAAGHSVTFSDYQEPALHVAALNARLNGFIDFDTLLLDWNRPGSMQYPVILGCEVIYERAIHRPILNVFDRMLAPGGEAWLGDPGRSNLPHFIAEAEARGYAVEIQNALGQAIPVPQFGEFQLLVLKRIIAEAG